MARKAKTLRDLNLNDLLVELRHSVGALHMYSEPSTLERLLSDTAFCDQLAKARDDAKEQMAEVMKRINAPAGYDD